VHTRHLCCVTYYVLSQPYQARGTGCSRHFLDTPAQYQVGQRCACALTWITTQLLRAVVETVSLPHPRTDHWPIEPRPAKPRPASRALQSVSNWMLHRTSPVWGANKRLIAQSKSKSEQTDQPHQRSCPLIAKNRSIQTEIHPELLDSVQTMTLHANTIQTPLKFHFRQ
jgi:hypothetical protein